MTQIRVDGDSSLGQILRDSEDLGFITVRDQWGKVIWSHSIESWKLTQYGPGTEVTLETRDVHDRIDEYLDMQRAMAEEELRVKGLL